MGGGLACTESADDRAFFSPVSTSALFGDVFPALSRRALGGRAERACRRRIVRHPAGPRPGGARSAGSQHHLHGGAVSGPSDVGAGGSELGERRGEGCPLPKPQGAQALRRLAKGGLEAPNAEPSQGALDPIDEAGALTNQALALTGWTLGILLFERRDLGHAAVAPLAAEPAQEGPLQQRGIQPICFSPPVLARDSDAGWVDDMSFDALGA